MSAKDILKRNKTKILDILCGDFRRILNKVHENALITTREYNNLKSISKENVEGHVSELVDKIMNKGEKTCQDFLKLLQTDEDVKETFPDLEQLQLNQMWPLSEPVQASTCLDDNIPHVNKRFKKDDVYGLNTPPFGLCFIINNENFLDGSVRSGTDKDAQSLAEVFTWLGFRVLMCKDQTKNKMDWTLRCLADLGEGTNLDDLQVQEWIPSRGFTVPQQPLQHADAFICCILSHGEKGVVLGTDMKPLSIKHVTKIFKASELSALTGKPKVFLIQACQGQLIHQGVMLKDLEADGGDSQTIPEEADVLVAMATVEDHPAFRHKVQGSWFVQSLCEQLKEQCPQGEDIISILHHVNGDVGGKEVTFTSGTQKQMPEVRFTLRKRLVLRPPTM